MFAEQLNCFYDLQPESVTIVNVAEQKMPFLGRKKSAEEPSTKRKTRF